MKRSEIRENIFKLVFCGEFHSMDELPEQVKSYFDENDEITDLTEEDRAYMENKFDLIKTHVAELDEKINDAATGWKTSRMNKTDLAILRLAVYEMLYDESVPVKVAINEAVELAKKFGGDESPAFVNGVLSKLA